MKSVLAQEIEKVWILRSNQEIESCFRKASELCARFGLGGPKTDEFQLRKLFKLAESQPMETQQIVLLQASVLRARGLHSESRAQVQVLEKVVQDQGMQPTPRLFFEKGINDFIQGNYSLALDSFLRALSISTSPLERLQTLTNLLLCLENLGLPFHRTLEELKAEIQEYQNQGSAADVRDILDQLRTFEMRRSFHSGLFSDALQKWTIATQDYQGQSAYYGQWIQHLPFLKGQIRSEKQSTEVFLRLSPEFHLKGFRSRTLQGVSHPDDAFVIKPSEKIDRIYLWVWRWLTEPTSYSFSRISDLLVGLPELQKHQALSMEDKSLLRNSLLWLLLFDPASALKVQNLGEDLGGFGQFPSSFLEFEYLVVHFLIAVRNSEESKAEDYYYLLTGHPLWQRDETILKELVEDQRAGGQTLDTMTSTSPLVKNLRALLVPKFSAKSELAMVVDLRTNTLFGEGLNKPVHSEILAKAISILKQNGSLPEASFFSQLFDIHPYDRAIHQTKIFNLLARLRALVPKDLIILKVKDGVVSAYGDWSQVKIIRDAEVSATLKNSNQWQSLGQTVTNMAKKLPTVQQDKLRQMKLVEAFKKNEVLSSQQISELLGTSSTTTKRLLNRWLSRKWLLSEGRARATKYRITERFLNQKLNGEQS